MNILDFINAQELKYKEVIYFGGSFNPWHEGHSECIKKAPKDALKIIIPDHNPHKELKLGDIQLPNLEELQKLNDNIVLFKSFFEEKKLNPTSDWLIPLSLALPQLQHSLLIGYDSYLNLFKWKNSQELIKSLSRLYVLNRQNNYFEKKYPIDTVFLGAHPYEELSSTRLRN